MSQDTSVLDPFGNQKNDDAFANRNIVFNMGGHTLRAINADGAGKQYIVGTPGTTYVFTNGTFWCSKDGAVTNSLLYARQQYVDGHVNRRNRRGHDARFLVCP